MGKGQRKYIFSFVFIFIPITGLLLLLINLSIDSYRYLSQVMSISMCRGGSNFYGGPLWSDMLESKRDFLKYDPEIPLYDAPVIQYVGHTTVNPEEQTVFRDKDSRSEIAGYGKDTGPFPGMQ